MDIYKYFQLAHGVRAPLLPFWRICEASQILLCHGWSTDSGLIYYCVSTTISCLVIENVLSYICVILAMVWQLCSDSELNIEQLEQPQIVHYMIFVPIAASQLIDGPWFQTLDIVQAKIIPHSTTLAHHLATFQDSVKSVPYYLHHLPDNRF